MTEAWSEWEGHVVNGEFQLKKYLGGSNQSAVFLTEAREREPKQAAIKLVAADPATAELQLARWELAQKLSHPHLIRLLRTGRCRLGTRELIFALMDYAEENLAQILPERPLTPQEAREMLEPALDALAYLHGQGFVHGHFKPANILATNDQLKLASDGICRADETVSHPRTQSIYDPLEISSGVRSPAGDIWSLGMTLAEVLTQRLPSWSDKDQAGPIVPENLPAPFLEIVRGCLRRDPQGRLTTTEIAARLGLKLDAGPPQPPARVAEAEPLPQARPAVSSRAESTTQRFAFPGAVAVLALAALLAGLGFLRRQPETHSKASAVKPEQKPVAQAPDAGRPSPKTPSGKAKTGQQPVSGGDGLQLHPAPAAQVKPQPASLQSETQAPARNSSSGDSPVAIVHQALPDVPQGASNTIQGTVRVSVRVDVDPSGSVVGAELDSPGPSRYFARLALQAAQHWKFAPSGQDVDRDLILHFEFRNASTRAFATRGGG
jgi:TonB family protein